MLDVRSPLGTNVKFEREGIILSETGGFTLTQIAGENKVLKKALGKIPTKIGIALEHGNRTLFRIGTSQFWILGEAVAASDGIFVVPLSSGRTCIQLEGPRARDILAACALIDFTPRAFKTGQFVMTGIHHTPVLIQCTDENTFHIYALRTFALNIWDWLCDTAQRLDHA